MKKIFFITVICLCCLNGFSKLPQLYSKLNTKQPATLKSIDEKLEALNVKEKYMQILCTRTGTATLIIDDVEYVFTRTVTAPDCASASSMAYGLAQSDAEVFECIND